jgi:long-chain acyl-CoA synthetase
MADEASVPFRMGYAAAAGTADSGPTVRNAETPHQLLTGVVGDDGCQNLHQSFLRGVALRPTAPCLGSRVRDDGSVGPFQWQTYQEVRMRVDSVAAGAWKLDLVPPSPDDGRRFLGFFLKNCRDWMVSALACYKTGVTVVPMYDTLGADVVSYIQQQTCTTTVLCSASELPKLIESCPFTTVIVTGHVAPAILSKARTCAFRLLRFSELEGIGGANLAVLAHIPTPKASDLAILCYTSGTTGNPKGAMLTHRNVLSAIGNAAYPKWAIFSLQAGGPQEIHLSYLPLAHVFETVVINFCLYAGAAIGFYQGDTLKLLDDLQTLRPTVFASVPRLYTRFYDKIIGGAKAKGGLASALFARGLAAKLNRLHTTGEVTHGFWDKLVFSKVQKNLGLDRCSKMICGSAPIAAEVKDFLRVALGVLFVEGYGLSETSAAATICAPEDLTNFHVGMPAMCCELKLSDVSEMGYASSNSPPSGEVCVRGPCVMAGYYKMPKQTEEAIDQSGWFHTGDIGAWTPAGCLRIIDRKKNIFKLAQGEYVAAEKIETVLLRCPLVAQIFVYGDSLQSYLVAIIVPDADEAAGWAKREGLSVADSSLSAIAASQGAKLAATISAQLKAASKDAKLAGFEMVKSFHIETEPFSVDNGLLTPTFKSKRNDLKKRYQQRIDEMYAAGVGPTQSKL